MPTDLTGTPTSLGIGTYNVDTDAPSGLGFNEAMAQIDALIAARMEAPASPAVGDGAVWNGTLWVPSSVKSMNPSGITPGTNGEVLTTVGGVTAWAAGAASTVYRKTTSKIVNTSTTPTDMLNGEITVGAGAMGTNKVLRLTAWGDLLQNTGAAQNNIKFQLALGATPTTVIDTGSNAAGVPMSPGALRYPWWVEVEIMNLGATGAQAIKFYAVTNYTTGNNNGALQGAFPTGEGKYIATQQVGIAQAFGVNTSTIDTTTAMSVQLLATLPVSNANMEIKLLGALAEVI